MHTFSHHLITTRHREPVSQNGFVLLMITLENAARIISAHVRKVGLSDMLGLAGSTNTSGDSVKRIDVFADKLLTSMLNTCRQVSWTGSEEQPELRPTLTPDAPYSVFFDPLDGSGNIDVGTALGTIFSIYHTTSITKDGIPTLPQGNLQIAAGYILYGSTTLLVYATAEGVEGFTLDPATGCFLHSHIHMHVPQKQKVYIANEANTLAWHEETRAYVCALKNTPSIKHRNNGCFVADVHTILNSGGTFLYPADQKNVHGKLRLLYEVCPMAYIMRAAGGRAQCALSSDDKSAHDPLTITPSHLHQKVGVIIDTN
jgi:fructose-1,6-bisphosphatase I